MHSVSGTLKCINKAVLHTLTFRYKATPIQILTIGVCVCMCAYLSWQSEFQHFYGSGKDHYYQDIFEREKKWENLVVAKLIKNYSN